MQLRPSNVTEHKVCCVEVLKTTFGPGEHGSKWQIVTMGALRADPASEQEFGLSRVKDGMHLAGQVIFGPISYFLGQSISGRGFSQSSICSGFILMRGGRDRLREPLVLVRQ